MMGRRSRGSFEDSPVRLSLLDRLADLPRAVFENRGESLRRLKQAVQEDLTDLLNTRVRAADFPWDYPEAASSVLVYGAPDFSAESADDPAARARLAEEIEEAVRLFEPRLSKVKAVSLEASERPLEGPRYRVTAMLETEPYPEPVQFDAVLDASSSKFRMENGG